MGKKEEAISYYTQALVIYQNIGDRYREGTTLNNLGSLANVLGRKDEAAVYYEQALMIRREVGDRSGEGVTLHNLGWLAEALGQREEAMDYFEHALTLFEDMGKEHDAQRVRNALTVVRERASMADADVPEVEGSVQNSPPASDMPIAPTSKRAQRRGGAGCGNGEGQRVIAWQRGRERGRLKPRLTVAKPPRNLPSQVGHGHATAGRKMNP